jgi:metallo-beta-lactamase family protein
MKWHFLGGADQVTGTKHLLEIDGARILFDCGLFQGRRKEANEINQNLGFDPATVDAMVLSHAHIDHCGNIPTLAKNGYRHPIHATSATADLLPIMLRDSAHIQEADAAYLNQKTNRRGLPPIVPLYTLADAEAALKLIRPHAYKETLDLPGGVRVTHVDAGHILGAALALVEIPKPDGGYLRVALAFDLGRRNLPLLHDPVQLENVDVIISESTYGDRLHDNALNAREELREAVARALGRGGKVIIPTFALGRAQEVVYHLAQLRERGEIPHVPVYVDSPMAHAITAVFENHPGYLDDEYNALRGRVGSVVTPAWLTFTESTEESKAITASKTPSIVIAASGMCEHGRILHHLKHGIENDKNLVLLVGYQAVNTLGRRLQNGEKKVRIFGDEFAVKAEIQALHSFSAHADRLELFRYVKDAKPKHVFLVHGEQDQRESFARLLRDQLHLDVELPANGSFVDFFHLAEKPPETDAPPAAPPPPFHAGIVAIVGRANSGKSSLLNAMLGEKISAVSPVAQTTRRPVRGILNEDQLQIVFLDTPGIRQASHTLSSMLNRTARGLVTGSDAVLLLLDASIHPQDEDRGWMQKLATDAEPIFAILNKCDLGSRRPFYEAAWSEILAKNLAKNPAFVPPPIRWFETSAATGDGLPELLAALRAAMPASPPLFPKDMLTDDPGPFFIADVIRSQINVRLTAELPHAIAVAVDQIEETDELVKVAATIYVEKSSQRPIVIGQRAHMIRDIRRAAEKELAEIYGKPHKLELWVKVEKNWSSNYWMLKKFGYLGG